MTLQETRPATLPGLSFITEDTPVEGVFTPEDFSEEHRMIAEMAEKFVNQEVVPVSHRIEEKEPGLTTSLMQKAGELGLLSIEVPEAYGGLGLDTVSAMIVAEKTGRQSSFGTSCGAHAGIGTLPIVYFGTEEQKKKYLPRIASGEWLAAFALTEASSGSDALAARTRAVLTEDGKHYVLNGQKMWITNAGFAQIFVVFAKVDGAKFTAFIVERDTPGFSIGIEEKKMGLMGSSTCLLNLEDVKIPVENVLGGIGRGARVALDVLNVGRLKLGCSCIGTAKVCIDEAVNHSQSRKVFGRSLSEFGAIKHKLAEMSIHAWAGEAIAFRAANSLGMALHEAPADDAQAAIRALEEYGAECAIIKVLCSEWLDYVADEAVQIFGGYGYSREYLVERQYRDSRINRLFEGTNEINRLAIAAGLLKKTLRGKSVFLEKAEQIRAEMLGLDDEGHPLPPTAEATSTLEHERDLLTRARKLMQYATHVALERHRAEISEQEEIQFHLADMINDVYSMETVIARAEKLQDGAPRLEVRRDKARVFSNDAFERVVSYARAVAACSCEGEELTQTLWHFERLGSWTPINTIVARRRIADAILEAGKYDF